MSIFKKKKKEDVKPLIPEEPETTGEVKYIEQLSNQQTTENVKEQPPQPVQQPVQQPIQLPVQLPVQQIVQQPVQPQLPKLKPIEKKEPEYREVPICLSQAQINNLIIENNIILKQIISEMD